MWKFLIVRCQKVVVLDLWASDFLSPGFISVLCQKCTKILLIKFQKVHAHYLLVYFESALL